MPMATIKQIKVLVKSTEEAIEKVNRADVTYKFGIQLNIPTQGDLTLEQVKTYLRKLGEALASFKEESPCNFGLEVSHDSDIDKAVVNEANKIYEAKASIQRPALVTPSGVEVEGQPV